MPGNGGVRPARIRAKLEAVETIWRLRKNSWRIVMPNKEVFGDYAPFSD